MTTADTHEQVDSASGSPFVPIDLVAGVSLVALAAVAVAMPGSYGTAVGAVVGGPLLFVLPGYALLLALFPERQLVPQAVRDEADDPAPAGAAVSLRERLALSFGLSVVVLPLVGVAVGVTVGRFTQTAVLAATGGVTVLGLAVGSWRRARLPADRRFDLPVARWVGGLRAAVFDTDRRLDGILNLVLVAAVCLTLATVAVGLVVPHGDADYTEFAILADDESGTEELASYERNLTADQAHLSKLRITNHEGENLTYTVVGQLQRVDRTGDGVAVRERQEVDRLRPALIDGETRTLTAGIRPSLRGSNLRLVYLLYRGDAPAEPTVENAHRWTGRWVNVTDAPA